MLNNLKKQICKVCNYHFYAHKEDTYLIRKALSPLEVLSSQLTDLYTAIDCPICGCQHILAPREARVWGTAESEGEENEAQK